MRTARRRGRGLPVASLLLLVPPIAVAAPDGQEIPPIDTGLVERSGVALMLLDVEVTDDRGWPVRGLTSEDFEVWLNGRRRSIYSVDDLCGCESAEALAAASRGGAAEATPVAISDLPGPPGSTTEPSEPAPFVLYLDFSQLRQDGRSRAVSEAKRWIQEVMRPEDQVMIAAFSNDAGLLELASFSTDKKQMIEALERVDSDPRMVDTFAVGFPDRVAACKSCIDPCAHLCAPECCRDCLRQCPTCVADSRQEYFHSRRSMKALMRLLSRIEGVPGHKTLLFFHQNGAVMLPYLYPCTDGDNSMLLDELAAEATRSRTSVHTVLTADDPFGAAVNLGANLADFTGGSYNHGESSMSGLVEAVGRGCACIYRVALEPPDTTSGQIWRARVEVAGGKHHYRISHLGELDRWWRNALAVLDRPESENDVPLAAAITPVAGRKDGWEVKLQVALDVNSVELLPAGGEWKGNWEVGVLLADERAKQTWEMLGISEVHRGEVHRGKEGGSVPAVVHERVIPDLTPGSYELRAFVRDRLTDRYGGMRARVELPRVGSGTLAGPLMRRVGEYFQTTLPFRRKRRPEPATRSAGLAIGPLPLGSRPVRAGEPLQFVSWACPAEDKETIYEIDRFVSLGQKPVLRFDEPRISRAGDCASIEDLLDTALLGPGRYVYRVVWPTGEDAEPRRGEVAFEVVAPAEPPGTPSGY